jgi:uncharacterized protein (TIGR01777 family)
MTSPLLWTLIAMQMAMGLFDTLYHHELTERLAWRPSQRRELQLHAVRNMLYAALFLLLGWSEPHGLVAIGVIAVLVVEVGITLADFVEEDVSRKLPASERINHTLLAINYGAILAVLLPVLVGWARQASGLQPAFYGICSIMTVFAALGVVVFALRDFSAARRSQRLRSGPAETLMTVLPVRQTVLVTGATGFIGRRLVEAFVAGGHQVIALTRDATKADMLSVPLRLVTSLEQIPDRTPIDAIINLAGEPITGGRWTAARRRRMLDSRIDSTMAVVRLIARLDRHPAVLISGSAVGWYGLRQDEALTESAEGRACFSRELCEAWEHAAMRAEQYGVRVIRLRTGLVLGSQGGMLARMLTPFEFGLGGPIGAGTQWMSWIERDDLVRLIAHIIARPELSGAINATAPMPVQNATFAAALARALHRPAVLRVPAALLRRLAGDLADELLLGGQRVVPEKALASGFVYRHRTLEGALSAILGTGAIAAGGEPRSSRPHVAHGID